jgi:VWFA-related protein
VFCLHNRPDTNTMNVIARAATALLWPALAIGVAMPAAAQDLVFRSSLDVVTIPASVRDQRGRPIADLQASDFDVLEDGTLRPILSVGFNRDSPVSVAVLVDMSGSMRLSDKMDMARNAFDCVLDQLRDGVDEVAVFTFDSALHERRGFTTDMKAAGDALDEFEPFGTTSLYDAAAAAAKRLSDRATTHKAIVLLTDGIDTSSTLSARQVSGVASAIDVPVYVVATVPSVDQRARMQASARVSTATTADLRDLADWTGGHFTFASTTSETLAVVNNVIHELRQQYVLAIEANGLGDQWKWLHVRVKRPAVRVRARSGYFGG